MSEFWIFIIIAGAIITFAKKEDKARRSSKGDITDIPQNAPHTGMERQIRELFDEANSSPQPVTYTIVKPTTKNTSHPKSATPKTATPIVAQESKPIAAQSPIKKEKSNAIPEILDDFTMEKAVIYSEILKPKFEEY